MALQALTAKRGIVRGRVTRLLSRPTSDLQVEQINDIISQADELRRKMESIYDDILLQSGEESIDTFQNEYDDDINRIDDFRLMLIGLKSSHKSQSTPSEAGSSSKSSQIMPVSIKIPEFKGDPTQWSSFSDLFKTVLENDNYSNAQKLQYLKSVVTGKASKVIEPFAITEANFEKAWLALESRFKDNITTINVHLDTIIKHEAVGDTVCSIDNFVDSMRAACLALEALGYPIHQSVLLVRLMELKLQAETQQAWRLSRSGDHPPTYEELVQFLVHRAKALVQTASTNTKRFQQKQVEQKSNKVYPTTSTSVSNISCPACSDNHRAVFCDKFKKLSVEERRALVSQKRLCFNCILPGHSSKQCFSGGCKECNKKHSSLLHIREAPVQNTLMNAVFKTPEQSLLPTATINVKKEDGSLVTFRALLDTGSMASLISAEAVQKLGIRTKQINHQIKGIAELEQKVTTAACLTIQSTTTDYTTRTTAMVVPTITSLLPTNKIHTDNWDYLKHVPLADPKFNTPAKIDMLLGVGIVSATALPGSVPPPTENFPWLHNTQLGWIVYGNLPEKSKSSQVLHTAMEVTREDFKKLWELEQEKTTKLTEEEEDCEKYFQTHTKRRDDGSYEVRLPLIQTEANLAHTRPVAVKRLLSLERKLEKDVVLKQEYSTQIQTYLDSGHMTKVPGNQLKNKRTCYLPHHGVIKESSVTTKLRIVFDASASTKGNLSLNQNMMKGPRVQPELFVILLRFRLHPVALTTDIVKMYRQIHVNEDQHDLQRILWRSNSTQPIIEYKINRLTFGIKAAPYLATRVLQQLADDEGARFPLASQAVKNETYVDDIITGAETPEKARELQEQLKSMLNAGKFELQKWASNCPTINNNEESVEFIQPDLTSALGVHWKTTDDVFYFTIQVKHYNKITKRTVLSQAAQLFDPLGWVSPVTILAKIFLQQLWKEDVQWDTALPEKLQEEWKAYQQALLFLPNIQIPRFVCSFQESQLMLCGFSDASEKALAAAVYIRSMNKGQITSCLIAAKTKIAPLRQVSIPRLELTAALMLVRLVNNIKNSINREVTANYWTDSTIALSWIAKPSYSWKTFVANRVSEIQENSSPENWHHVLSDQNPADKATRGITPETLKNDKLWWCGPAWLTQEPIPLSANFVLPNTVPEEKKVHSVVIMDHFWDKFSSLTKLIRVTSYILRFIEKCRSKQIHTGYIRSSEYDQTLQTIIRCTQAHFFSDDVRSLKQNKSISNKSKLRTLTPFIDNKGLLRMSGRIKNSAVSYDFSCPIILPSKSHITWLIVRHEHLQLMHANTQLLLANLRRRYWIISGRQTVKRVIHNCVTCAKAKAKLQMQIMADLPKQRVTPCKAFYHTGVDFAGPIQLKQMNKRSATTVKGYICLFVCMATKALHLETVSCLSSEAFIATLRRFIARRGQVSKFYSDCGSNFIGANNDLHEIMEILRSKNVIDEISPKLMEWQFNPPHAPHFGGLWEAGVKSVKNHLQRVVGSHPLNFEELTTVLAQIEACLNSRPLCELTDDPDDLQPLTPGHFLVGGPLTAVPDVDVTELPINRLSRWQLVQKLTTDFWKRWQAEYLVRLQSRPKWNKSKPNLEVNTLVMIKDMGLPPTRWRMGRVLQVFYGSDGKVRVVKLKTASGETTRPVHELVKLPVNEQCSESENKE